ncbi:uncharacterized protein LOC120937261 isoform X1 [Rana temporaria]|uniref:uncharacterized protein LOC120937261 isoform X1 n=1 Tax=Rana temporaria TaxID=8407 RepID=UPI001AAC8982|nr:uncharacterized protein LOC120937261 isoform X1 [Rana temporaria]
MEIVNLMDLSFLTKEEQVIIQRVLKRDTDLRKREEKRIRKMKRQALDLGCLKLQTGEWFEELRERRFKKYSSATDLLKCVLEHKQPGTLSSKRISWLSKITSIKTLQTALPSPPNSYDFPERCHHMVKENINDTDGFTTVPNEQLSVTQILKDLEIILDLEIQNLNSTVEIADINGSSPENVLVDKTLSAVYNSHQVWHYPELMDMNTEQANVSPLPSIITKAEEDLLPCKYRFQLGGNTEYRNNDYLEMPHLTDPTSSLVCSGQLETPFCSSPFLPEQFVFSENCFRFDSPSEFNAYYFKVQSDHQSKDSELSSEQSLDTESTLEPTIIPVCSPIMIEDNIVWREDVPLIGSNL